MDTMLNSVPVKAGRGVVRTPDYGRLGAEVKEPSEAHGLPAHG